MAGTAWTEEEKAALFEAAEFHAFHKGGKIMVHWGEVAGALGSSRTASALAAHFHSERPDGVECKANAYLPSEDRALLALIDDNATMSANGERRVKVDWDAVTAGMEALHAPAHSLSALKAHAAKVRAAAEH